MRSKAVPREGRRRSMSSAISTCSPPVSSRIQRVRDSSRWVLKRAMEQTSEFVQSDLLFSSSRQLVLISTLSGVDNASVDSEQSIAFRRGMETVIFSASADKRAMRSCKREIEEVLSGRGLEERFSDVTRKSYKMASGG